ncbi:MAG: hypothetical protein QM778_20805 [Myxococcales bacterium]
MQITRLLGLGCLVLLGACAKKPTAYETLPQLRQAIEEPVTSPEQNQRHSQLVQMVSEEGHLEGLSRTDVEAKIGKGDVCSKHPLCSQQGFMDDDWYYEIGTASEGPDASYLRYRPALILGFNRFGKVERTYVLRVE